MFVELNTGQLLNVFKIGLIQVDGKHIIYTLQNGLVVTEHIGSEDGAESRMSELKSLLLKG